MWKAQGTLTHLAQKSWHLQNILEAGKHRNDIKILLRSWYQENLVENNFVNAKCIKMFFFPLAVVDFLKSNISRIKKPPQSWHENQL